MTRRNWDRSGSTTWPDGAAHVAERCELEWLCPGSVWAMDFSHPPHRIDACFGAILNVRDLASHQQLLWLPVEHEDAATVIDALDDLFVAHGAPLVLKCDNGPAFRAKATKGLLRKLTFRRLRRQFPAIFCGWLTLGVWGRPLGPAYLPPDTSLSLPRSLVRGGENQVPRTRAHRLTQQPHGPLAETHRVPDPVRPCRPAGPRSDSAASSHF